LQKIWLQWPSVTRCWINRWLVAELRDKARAARVLTPHILPDGSHLSQRETAIALAKSGLSHFTAAYGALGLSPDGGMSWRLPRLVGMRRAQDIILTNRRMTSEEAAAIGLVSRMVEDDELAEVGAKVAAELAAAPTAALGAARNLLLDSFETPLEAQLECEARSIAALGRSAETRAPVAAFLERRNSKN
jgi:enoyl-CoA hydratase/carnithine racemase